MHDICATENPDIDILDGHVAQNDTRNDNRRNGDTIGNFAEYRTCRAQSG